MFYTKAQAKEAAHSHFKGVWATMHTPMTEDWRIDEAGLRSNIDQVITHWKLDGLMFNGAVGEFWALTRDEQCRVIEVAVDATKGRCGNIVMTTATSVDECVALTRFAQEVGADFVAPFSPVFPSAPEKGVISWFNAVASQVDIGMWMIDTGLAGPHLSVEAVGELAKLPNIVGLKVQRGADHFSRVQEVTGGSIVISDPHEASLLQRMRQGQQVYMSAPAPILMQRPGSTPIVDYVAAARAGDWDLATEISDSLVPLRKLYERYLSSEMFQGTIAVALIKAWSSHLGLATGPVRPPLVDLNPDDLANLVAELEGLGVERSSLSGCQQRESQPEMPGTATV